MNPARRASAFPRRKITIVGTLPSKVSIIGAGAVGSTMGLLLYERGYNVISIINRRAKDALPLAKIVHCPRVSASVRDIAPETEVLLVAVSDDALEDVVLDCARRARLRKPLVIHTSGVHSLDVLKPLQRKGALIGSIHPIQSFPAAKNIRDRVKSASGIYYGIEGEGKALDRAQQLVRVLGGKAVVVPKGLKPLYHAACVFASNYVVTLLSAVAESAASLGLGTQWKELMLPLFTTTVENVFKTSPQEALTGPIVRHDVRTIERHLDVLGKQAPQLVPLYAVLAVDTARIARGHARLTSEQFRGIVSLIRRAVKKYLKTSPRKKEHH